MAEPKAKDQKSERAMSGQPSGAQGEVAPARRGGRESAMTPFGDPWGWGPMMPFRRLFEDFDRLFEDVSRGVFGRGLFEGGPPAMGEGRAWAPRIEVRDAGRELVVSAELPGVDPKDVQIECTDEGLVLRGETRQEETQEQGGVWRSERRYGSFFRQIPLPEGIDLDKAQAEFRNGLLTVRLPKPEPAQSRVRRIPIAGASGGAQGGGQSGGNVQGR